MSIFKHNLYEPLSLSGSFEFGDTGAVVGGELVVEPNHLHSFKLQVFKEQRALLPFRSEVIEYSKTPYIHAILDSSAFCTIQNPIVRQSCLFGGGESWCGLSKHIVFNNYFKSGASFIQKTIKVPDNLREQFQEYWLNKIKDVSWLKF